MFGTLISSIFNIAFIVLAVSCFGFIIYANIVETRAARRKLLEAERKRHKP
jgi:hypothetical protein